ncbi:hypothetical protein Hanom_Chr05g00407541 [Helianthus anomalus]
MICTRSVHGSVLTKNHNHNRDVNYWITTTITDWLWWLWLFGFDGYRGSVMVVNRVFSLTKNSLIFLTWNKLFLPICIYY